MIKLMRFFSIKAAILFACLNVFSQQGNAVYDVNPVSPEAAALFKSTERPIGSFSGTVPVSIPIYTLETNHVNLPITLNYNMGGIKVEEVASAVGLGWSLSAGGCVTRVLNGVADDYSGGFLRATLKPSEFLFEATGADIASALNGNLDLQPDLFYFNCNGISGRFFFNDSGKVVIEEQTGIKIEPVWQYVPVHGELIMGWILTDLQGVKYYMGLNRQRSYKAVDYTSNVYTDPLTPGSRESKQYSSSWHLTEIADMNDISNIRLEYDSTHVQFSTRSDAHVLVQAAATIDCNDEDFYDFEKYVETHISEKFIKKITSDNCSIEFNTSHGRKDCPSGFKLNLINVSNIKGVLRKQISFGYDYFSQPNAPSGIGNDVFYKRLKLNYITEYSGNLQDSLRHDFDYIEDVNLPSRLSKGTDYWGYYSGKDQNTSIIPNGYYVGWGAQRLTIMNRADRRANPMTSKANSLKRITFPSGGSREFIYEPNLALLDFYSQVYPDSKYYPYNGFDTFIFGSDPSLPRFQQNFTVNSSNGGAQFYFSLSQGSYVDIFSVKIIKMLSPSSEIEYRSSAGELAGDFYLTNGNYRFEFYFNSLSDFHWMEGYWLEETLSIFNIPRYGEECRRSNITVGGIRIKEIIDTDPIQNKTYSTKYKYTIPGDTTLSSGLLITPVRVMHAGECSTARSCIFLQLSSTSAYPLTTQGSSYVYYPEVRTIYEENGFIDREYSFEPDIIGYNIDINQYPPLPPPSKSWKRGKLLLEKIYDSTGLLLSKNTTVYPFIYPSDVEPVADSEAELMRIDQYGGKLVGRICHFDPCICYDTYLLSSIFSMPKESFSTIYSSEGAIETKTKYSYCVSEGRPFLKSKRTYMSNDDIQQTNYCYAFSPSSDFKLTGGSTSQAILDTLLVKNYLIPIETRTYHLKNNDSVLLTGEKTSFQYFNGSKIYPYSIQHYTTLSDYVGVVLPKYDSKGNILEKYSLDNVKECYLWGYNSQYPVAKIIGIDHYTASQYVDQSILDNVDVTPSTLLTELDKLRTNLTGALVFTYSYDPIVGMISETDPAGRIVYYEYDDFSRLTTVRNQDSKVLKQFDYQYNRPLSH